MGFKNVTLGLCVFLAGSTGFLWAQDSPVKLEILAGNQAYAAKDYAKAVAAYQNAVKLDPQSAPAYQGLGNSYYGLGQKTEALAAYEKSLQLNPNNPSLISFVPALRVRLAAGAASPVVTATPELPKSSEGVAQGSAVIVQAPVASPITPEASPTPVLLSPDKAVSNPSPVATPVHSTATTDKPVPGQKEKGVSESPRNRTELSLLGGVAISANSGYGAGFGGGVEIFFPTSDYFSVGASLSGYTFDFSTLPAGYSADTSNMEFLVLLKCRLGRGGFHPYLFGGGGISDYSITSNGLFGDSYPSMNPMVQGGVGAEFPLGDKTNFFIQGRYSLAMLNAGTFAYVPLEMGFAFNK